MNAAPVIRPKLRLSLTARLTLLFAIGASVVLLGLGWLISQSIERHFEELDREALQHKLMLAHHAIARVTSTTELASLPSLLSDAATGHHDLLIQITGANGQTVLAPPNGEFSGDWRPTGLAADGAQLLHWSHGGRRFRGLVSAMSTGIPGAPPLQVAVALDTAHHEVFMDALRQTLWLFVAGAAVVTGLLGWFAAMRGLAPLKAMRARAALVNAHTLDQRLPTDAVPTELAALATTLNEMLERLEDAFRRLSDFSSDIAHELRTPVSNLMTQTQVSLSRDRDAAGYRDILESNAEEFERLARMIADMLFLAKADHAQAAAQTLVQRERIDLQRQVVELFEFYEALADEKGVRLELIGQATAMGDRLMLRRALSNLLSNALRYTAPGGVVQVRLDMQAGRASLAVDNPGATIAPEHLAHVFERFYRADASRQSATGEGTGLGLAITQAIVLAHGGHIAATSADGHTCFTVELPGV
ncbi:MAG: heavy metal sensor histidine kinase [Rhodoferax sp.]|nr:heavy metal sensor histidine kinase [Rhodoferax sp.]